MDGTNRLGPYRVRQVLGRDAAGVACVGEDRDGVIVELRVLPLVLARDEVAIGRLAELAAAIRGVSHPNLRRLLAFDRDPVRPELVYLVCEHRGTVTLKSLMSAASHGLPETRVVAWAGHLAAALDHLHGRGLAHGAIDPAWIVIDEDDVASLPPPQIIAAMRGTGGPPTPDADLEHLAAALDAALETPEQTPRERRARRVPGGKPVAKRVGPLVAGGVALLLIGTAALWPRSQEMPPIEPAPARQGVAADPAPARPRAPLMTRLPEPVQVDVSGMGRGLEQRLAALPPDPGCVLIQEWNEAAMLIADGWTHHDGGRIDDAVGAWREARRLIEAIDMQREAAAAAELALQRYELAITAEPAGLAPSDRDRLEAWRAEAHLAGQYRQARAFEAAAETWDRAAAGVEVVLSTHAEDVALVASSEASWNEARAASPSPWLEEPAVRDRRRVALAAAEDAHTHRVAGEPAEACAAFNEAAAAMREATDLHETAVATLVDVVMHAAGRGRLDNALRVFARIEPFVDAAAVRDRIDAALDRRAVSGAVTVNTLGQRLVHPGRGPAIWIATREVTRGQFRAFVDATGHVTDGERDGWSYGISEDGRWRRVPAASWREPGFAQDDDHPVVAVSARDAEAFCRWLSAVEARVYRLPAESEWQRACGGAAPDAGVPVTNAADVTWTRRFGEMPSFTWNDGHLYTAPVGSYAANASGFHDLHGNAQEWCRDAYAAPGGETPIEASAAPRVLRGGSFAAPPAHCRCDHRDGVAPDARSVTLGFRVVME